MAEPTFASVGLNTQTNTLLKKHLKKEDHHRLVKRLKAAEKIKGPGRLGLLKVTQALTALEILDLLYKQDDLMKTDNTLTEEVAEAMCNKWFDLQKLSDKNGSWAWEIIARAKMANLRRKSNELSGKGVIIGGGMTILGGAWAILGGGIGLLKAGLATTAISAGANLLTSYKEEIEGCIKGLHTTLAGYWKGVKTEEEAELATA